MNERIKELIDKSELYIAYDNKAVTEKELEFFAELIVRECDKYVTERWDVCEPWMDPGDLLKHFGVEE